VKNSLLATLMLTAMAWPAWCYAQPAPDAMAKTVKPAEMKWEPLDGGFEISILYTNPASQATYLMIRGPGNLHVPRHWHSANETITILQGSFMVAHDGSPDKTALAPGGFLYMPARMIHEAWTGRDGATYFITVDGKWDIHFVE
jgi:anti-sigma factor ChrR (cupin superfamily)